MADNNLNFQNEVQLTGDEVVISGISGIFPKSNNVLELMENLYNKVDMVTVDETISEHVDLPKYSGKISGIHKFDNQFFRVTHKQTITLEPVSRKLMEQAYCAMFDAGVNPLIYKGKKIGVFTATQYAESSRNLFDLSVTNAFMISGSSKTMLSNRISYWLDAKGPSYTVESLSGSLLCLKNAYESIVTGLCEAAIVGGCEFGNDEVLSINLRNAGLLSMDGKTKCFDKNGDGYVKSQAIGVIFLQKAKDAKRIYAEICKIDIGLKHNIELNQTIHPHDIVGFWKKIYAECDVSPNAVEYIEAHGSATPKVDSCELQAIGQVFANDKPIKVGSIKSNMGGTEAASGICAIIKLCLAYHKGKLAANLHYNDPLDIPAIKENKVEVLTDIAPFNRTFSAVNHFSYTGTNCHVILKGHFKPKNLILYNTNVPRLVLISGRHKEGVTKIFDILRNQPVDPELLGMIQDIYHIDTPALTYRGSIILDYRDEQTVTLAQSAKLYQGSQRPLWFVYSGMGSQWAGMGAELMRIPLFASSIEKCRQVLEPKGVDIVRILTAPDETVFDNVLNSFVGIAAVQIGLSNIVKEMGLMPDNFIGHSLGETGCAYCDGCLSAEDMILTAYARGLVSIQSKLIKGSMAAIGLGYKDMLPLCPPEIDIACHNSSNSCTISGPADVMKTFVTELKAKGIFAKEVRSRNIAYHSRYIKNAGAMLLILLKDIIKKPTQRSNRWISTSWPEDKQDEPAAKFSSAEYHTNNFLSPVYFEEAARLIPHNAVVVEIAPHGLMQAILKKSHPECTHVPLTQRDHSNPLKFLFEAFGKLYQEGFNLKVDIMYPKIQYPVSTETPLLSHFVEWYHEEDWKEYLYKTKPDQKSKVPSRKLVLSIQENNYKFLAGHRRGGNIVLPEAAIIFYVWESLALYMGVNYKELSVAFHDVQFYAENIIDGQKTMILKFSINKGNNYFEVERDDIMIAKGVIETLDFKFNKTNADLDNADRKYVINLNSDDVYNIMKIKGHCYENEFQSIYSSSSEWNFAQINVTGNWITFLDSLFQLNVLARNHDGVSAPKLIKNITINMSAHETTKNVKRFENGVEVYEAVFDKYSGVTKCGGVKINNLIFNDKPADTSKPDVLEIICSPSLIAEPTKAPIETIEDVDNNLQYKLIQTKPGLLHGLKWVDVEKTKNNVVKVSYAAVSNKDVQIAMNLLESEKELGMDFSGFDSSGNKVIGLVPDGAISNMVKPDEDLLWPVPDHWTLEEAATVPLPYVLAYYCLVIRSNLQLGHFVFVTDGAGALGKAVISVCLSLGCTVYTTIRDARQKQFLKNLFPHLNESNIGCRRDLSFYNVLIKESRKTRDNIVVNYETGYLRELAMKCVNPGGYFLDVSKYDMLQNKDFGMMFLTEYKMYKVVDLQSIFRPENVAEKKLLQKIVAEGIANGTVKPICYSAFSVEELEKAFRLTSIRSYSGRALIRIGNVDPPMVLPRLSYSDGAYLIVCDDQPALSIQLMTYLVKNGARNLIFHHNFKGMTGLIEVFMRLWKSLGANIKISTENLQIKKNCVDVMHSAGNLNGIFVITANRRILKINEQSEINNTVSKVITNLDDTSRNNCPYLKYFVILSPTSINEVNVDTSTVLDKICDMRAKVGLPALVVRTAMLDEEDYLKARGPYIRPLTIQTALRAMEISLNKNYTSSLAYNIKITNTEYLKRVARILGIQNMDGIFEKLYVKDFLPNETNIQELKALIQENMNVDLPIEYIKEMEISSLKNIYKVKTRQSNQLFAFYDYVDDDINKATEIFVPMTTINDIEGDQGNLPKKDRTLFLIPGFEGHHYIFKPMCEGLKMKATTLQFGPDVPSESIHKIAYQLKQEIKKRFDLKPQFYLLGYSFGVNVALEIAALLEEDDLVGVVFCLDSSPDALRMQLDAYLGKLTEEEVQNAVIKHLFYVISGHKYGEEEVTDNINNWEEKVALCVRKLKMYETFSDEYKKDVINGFYDKICLARSYHPTFKLKSKIVLLKGTPHPNMETLPSDYELSKYAKNPVQVINIDSDMASAPYDLAVPNFVNQFINI